MTVMEPGSEILKVDETGRVRTPPEKREALLAEFDRSGMTGAQFARFSAVRYPTLMNWLQKLRKEPGQGGQMATPMPGHLFNVVFGNQKGFWSKLGATMSH